VSDNAHVWDIWKDYIEELYNKNDKSTDEEAVLGEADEDNVGPHTYSESEQALSLKQVKNW